MLGLALALTTLGGWTYAGFLANPVPPPTPAPLAPATPPAPPNPGIPHAPQIDAGVPAAPPRVGDEATAARASSARYRLADISGQVWEHAELGVLQTFVLRRNAALSTPSLPEWPR